MYRRYAAAAVICLLAAATAHAQFGRRFSNPQIATPKDFDGRFHYCRVVYRAALDGRGGNWTTDYPRADINMSVRLSELTKIGVSMRASRDPNHLLVRLGGDELFQCPLVILSAPGQAMIDESEAPRLREYLLKGGMLWADDFWGTYQWQHWEQQLRKVLPASQYAIFDVPLDHPARAATPSASTPSYTGSRTSGIFHPHVPPLHRRHRDTEEFLGFLNLAASVPRCSVGVIEERRRLAD